MTAPTAWWCPNCGHTVNAPTFGDLSDPEPGKPMYPPMWEWCEHEAAGGGHCTRRAGHRNADDPASHNWCYCNEDPCGTLALAGVTARVPVGDDTPEDGWALRTPPDEACPKCGAAFHKHERSDLIACLRGLGAVNDALMAEGQVGDDTPAFWACACGIKNGVAFADCAVCGHARPVGDDTSAPTAQEVIRKYLIDAPEQGDWEWEEHCDGLAMGLVHVLKARGYALNRAGTTPDLTALPTPRQVQAECHRTNPRFIGLHDVRRVLAAVAAVVRSAQNDTDGGTDAD